MYVKKLYIALSKIIHVSKIKKLTILLFFIVPISADSFNFNSYNNHGVVGIINMPTARFYDESVHGITLYDGTPDQKITLSSNPFNWMEASFFYTSLQNRRYCQVSTDPLCKQDYKDKGFNIKLRLKKEGILPAIAIGLNDFAGTGFYSSEYVVASYGVNNLDMHLGLGYGTMNSSKASIKNPLGYLSDNFKNGSLKNFLRKLAFMTVLDAMETACIKTNDSSGAIKYFCAICWNKIREGA